MRWEELRYLEVYDVVREPPDPKADVEGRVLQRETLRELVALWQASSSEDEESLLEAAEMSYPKSPAARRRYKRLKERLRRIRKRCVENQC